jgi:putative glycosyltransferase
VRLSVVATLYRSSAHLAELHERITRVAARCADEYEIVLVNDGSPDDSLERAIALHERDPRVRVIDLARNFGHHKAMMTGLAHARGDYVFLIDSDLEEEPELLDAFLEKMRAAAADVVYGVQKERRGGLAERWSGRLFFWIFNWLSDYQIPENLVTVRLMTRRYVTALVAHREREMMIAGLWALTGFRQVGIPITKQRRSSTTYGLGHKIALLVNSITSFSSKPLELIFYLGISIGGLAACAAAYLVIRRIFFGILLPGWPSLIVSIWLLGGLMMACLGVIGIYVSKVFVETKQRPYTVVRHIYEPTSEHAAPDDSRNSGAVLR